MNLIKILVLPLFTLFSVAYAEAPIVLTPLPVGNIPIEHNALVAPDTPLPASISSQIRLSLPPIMVDIARLESGFNPKAYNPEWHYDALGNKVCQGSYGIFQIACVHYLENPERLYDVEFNLEMAKKVLYTGGILSWGVCHGKIQCI
jgi:hypothetical protein